METRSLKEMIEECASYDPHLRARVQEFAEISNKIDEKQRLTKSDKGQLAVCDREIRFNMFMGAMNGLMIEMVKHMAEIKGIDLGVDDGPTV